MRTQRYTPEFKEEAVRHIVDRGYSVSKFLLVLACRVTACISG